MAKEFIPCKNPKCGNTPQNVYLQWARAKVEFDSLERPGAECVVTCDRCGQTSRYTSSEILELIDPNFRPHPLPSGFRWAFILAQIPTEESMRGRAFFGERVLVKDVQVNHQDWSGRIVNDSKFTPYLTKNSDVGGFIDGSFFICHDYLDDQQQIKELICTDIPKGSVFAVFFLPSDSEELQIANLFCANPSCGYVFSTTYQEFKQKQFLPKDQKKELEAHRMSLAITVICPACGIHRIINESSFDGLYKM